MPTKTKDSLAQRLTAEIEDLKERRFTALAQIQIGSGELSAIRDRQNSLALSVLSGDEAATAQNDELAEAYIREERALAVARAGVQQAEERIDGLKSRRAAEERRVHKESFEALGREARRLDEDLEAAVRDLVEKLERRKDLDQEQRREGYAAGMEFMDILQQTIGPWLLERLRGWVSETPAHYLFQTKTLSEMDRRAL